MGKARTSVGPSPSIHRWFSSVMYSTSTSRIASSASGLTPISSSACLATVSSVSELTSTPDSLAISMDKAAPGRGCGARLPAAARPAALHGAIRAIRDGAHGLLGLLRLVPACVRVDDLAHQPVAHDVGAAAQGEVHILDAVEDLTAHPQ